MEASADIVKRSRIGPNLQKTKDIIGAEVRGASHKLGPLKEFCRRSGFYSFFFATRETIFEGWGYTLQANTRPAARPPSGQSDIPRKGNLGGGTTWPASPFYLPTLYLDGIPTLALGREMRSATNTLRSCRAVQPFSTKVFA